MREGHRKNTAQIGCRLQLQRVQSHGHRCEASSQRAGQDTVRHKGALPRGRASVRMLDLLRGAEHTHRQPRRMAAEQGAAGENRPVSHVRAAVRKPVHRHTGGIPYKVKDGAVKKSQQNNEDAAER